MLGSGAGSGARSRVAFGCGRGAGSGAGSAVATEVCAGARGAGAFGATCRGAACVVGFAAGARGARGAGLASGPASTADTTNRDSLDCGASSKLETLPLAAARSLARLVSTAELFPQAVAATPTNVPMIRLALCLTRIIHPHTLPVMPLGTPRCQKRSGQKCQCRRFARPGQPSSQVE